MILPYWYSSKNNQGAFSDEVTSICVEELPTVIPEPSTLLGLGLALGLGALSLNRKQKK